MGKIEAFEEYKLFVQDTARLSDRRQTVTNTYVAVNSLLLGAISFLLRDAAKGQWWGLLLALPLLIAGIVISRFWGQFIYKYKTLIGLRLDTLRSMENQPEMSGSVRMYHVEDAIYPRDEDSQMIPGRGLNISDLEKRLPTVFLALYIIYLICALAVMTWTGIQAYCR